MEPINPFKMAANVQSMYQYWKHFDLQQLQRELDNTATEIANRQDESDVSRRRLVAQCRDFKKNTPEDVGSAVTPLLRSFQLEVDSLCQRSKAAEAAFLSVYTKLIHLPDPVAALQLGRDLEGHAGPLVDMEVENQQQRAVLTKYGHDLVDVHRQVVTITQIKEQGKDHEDREGGSAQTRTKQEREQLTAFAVKERQLHQSQVSLTQKLAEAEHQIASLHAGPGLETSRSELIEAKSKYDQVTPVKSSDMEMVKAELDHANERAANAERQAERLKHQLTLVTENVNLRSEQQSSASDYTMDILKRSSLEMELAAKDKEVARLIEDVKRLNKLRETALTQVTRLEAELSAKNQAFRALEEKLRTQDNYEDVKRELRVLKSTDFANAYNEESNGNDRKSLELLLLEKSKLLHTNSTHLKLVNSCLPYTNIGSSATFQTTNSSTKKSDRSPTLTPSPASPVPLFSPTSTAISAALVSAAIITPTFNRCSSVSSAKTSATEVTTTSTVPKVMSSSLTLSAATVIKQEAPSLVSTIRHPTPHSVAYTSDSYTNMAISDLTVNFLRMPSTPSSGRYSPTANCKLSPDIPTPSQTPHANSGPPQSPISALHPHMDQRHFAPPFYGFPSSPFHPAFLPLNMVKSEMNASGGLDTGYVAKTVRELLSIHNIGQRLFAKHVLGLSQGTVSELLSKPKSWDKLTEKGRESYRKMHAWAIDDANIMALKAISPKKGTQPITANNSYKEKEDTATEERIANILSEAQVAMHMKKSLEQQQVAGAIVSSLYHHELSKLGGAPPGLTMMSPTMPPVSLSNGPHYSREMPRKMKDGDSRYHSSSSSQEDMASAQEIVTRIYRQELIKLKKAADAAGNIAASAMYAQELSRLDTSQNTGMPITSSSQLRHSSSSSPAPDSPEPSPLALDYRSTRPNGLKLKTEPPDSTFDDTASHINSCGAIDLSKPSSHAGSTPSSSPTSESGRHNGSAFFLVRPRMNGHDSGVSESPLTPTQQQQQGSTGGPRYGSVPPAECLSPLQRMQNIANSLTTRPNVGMPSNKPLRAILPPITQEEFDRYANVNTDDLVKKIKETLSQYSISQRLFGESILGLSQGSVSDLLARPKPWHMLTQKGREPFIRMQIFLEDAESIPKLVASQYRIPPDKLMRSSSRGSSEPESPCDLPAQSRSQGGPMPSQQHQASLPPPPPPPLLMSHPPPLSLTSILPTSCSTNSPSSPSPSLLSPSALSASRHSRPSLPPPPPPPHPLSLPHSPILPSPTTPTSLGGRLGPPIHIPPSLPHGIGPSGLPLPEHFLSTTVGADPASLQRVWGTFAYPSSMLEVIAMTSEIDTLSLTSRVKDVLQFHNLGQKLFGEAVLGLSQGSVSELLSKPKPWHMLSIKGREPFIKMHLWLGDPQNVEHLKLYQTQMKAHRRRKSSMDDRSFDSPTQPKRPRVFFTEDQKDSLRQAYSQDPYPNQSTIETLAKNLNVGVKTVINWFHNHRMRAKQQHHAGGDTSIKSEPDESSNQSDISSMSGDVTSAMTGGQFFHGGITPTDVNQWIFPQFEPVGLMRKVPCLSEDNSEDNKENNGGLEEEENDGDEDDEPDGLDTSILKNSTKKKDDEDVEEKGNKSEAEDDEGGKHEGDDLNDDSQILTKSGEDTCGGTSLTAANSGSVNKRKRSNPQRVFEGAQLDRTLSVDKGTAGSLDRTLSVDKGTADSLERTLSVDKGTACSLDQTLSVDKGAAGSLASHHATEDKVELVRDSLREQSRHCSENILACTNIKYISTQDMNGHACSSDNVSSPADSQKYFFKSANTSNTSRNKQEYDNQKYDQETEHRVQKIEKIQKAFRSTVEHWDDDDADDEKVTCSSIEKIQKHLETKSTDEDWEF